jgi:hypothetical protein
MIGLALAVLAVIGAGAAAWIVSELRAQRAEHSRNRTLTLIDLFSSAAAAAADDPRALLVWQPLAEKARTLFPSEFGELDRVFGGRFPFSREQIQTAHARWTAEWLAWERTHDAEYKMKAATAEEQMAASGSTPAARARLNAIESEKLDRYQRRYEEYTRVSKALRVLAGE